MPCSSATETVPSPIELDAEVSNHTDAELMEAVARGDARSFACLMQRHLKDMVALAQRITGIASEADEIAQEGFLRLWTNAPKWDPEGKATIKTWLSRVIVNLCLDRLRKRRTVPLDDTIDIEDTSASAFDKTSDNDKRRVLKEALDELPERQRIAVVLSYYNECSGAEIAETMHISLRAVESLLVRARRTLRAHLSTCGIVGNEDI